ncbi:MULTISPECIES: nucleosidase [Streptomyces]|uniref:Nucleosidase n=1 Tax=Streptomyces kaempferi TaxID=333725 RepID=A0ABW3XP34_9ACTN|nr:nucleosidase [Streptomyces sp. NBC_01455]
MSLRPVTDHALCPRLLGEIRSDRPLIVAAVEEEAAHLDGRFPLLVTGMGKVNAAAALALALSRGERPGEIVNLGTAGALKEGLSGLHEISRVVQHDLDTALLHKISGRVYGAPLTVGAGRGPTLATGDTFVTDSAVRERLALEADLVDMEGYAVATVAQHLDIPVRLVKFVSDSADEDARTTWPEALDHAAGILAGWVEKHIPSPRTPRRLPRRTRTSVTFTVHPLSAPHAA